MSKAHPLERRKMTAMYRELLKDYNPVKASQIVAESFPYAPRTIRDIANRIQDDVLNTDPVVYSTKVEQLISEDFEVKIHVQQPSASTIIPADKRLLEIVASDIHFPYEDNSAYQLFLQVLDDLQPDILVLLGDIIDCYSVSAHDKDANRATPAAFKEEVLYAKAKLEELRSILPNTRIIYKEGNHETRLSRYIAKNAAALSNLGCVTVPELLRLHEYGIEWVGNDDRLRIGKMWHIHGNEVSGAGMSPARLKYGRMQCSFIFGHHHQRDKYRPRAYDGSQHGAYANPCLCDLEPEYMHHTHAWSHGFTIIDHDSDSTFQVEETEIIKPSPKAKSAKCNVRGKIYTFDTGIEN